MPGAFDPFLAYELIDDNMAAKLHDVMKHHRQSIDAFVEDEVPDLEKAREVMISRDSASISAKS